MTNRIGMLIAILMLLRLATASAGAESSKSLLARADSLLKIQKADSTAISSAIVMYQMALQKAEMEYGKEDTLVATIASCLGDRESARGKYEEAEGFYRRALGIREAALGSEHPDVGSSLHRLAVCCYVQGKYTEAEPLYKRALNIAEKAVDSAPAAEITLNDLAILYFVQDKYLEAETYFKRAVDMSGVYALELKDPPYLAKTLENLAFLYYQEGRFDEAEWLYIRAWNLRAQASGLFHPDVAGSLTDLAILYFRGWRYSSAVKFFDGALSIFLEQERGYESTDAARVFGYKSKLYEAGGRHKEAESFQRMALDIEQKAVKRDYMNAAENRNNPMFASQANGKGAEAEELRKRTLDIREKALGSEHSGIVDRLNDMAILCYAQKKYREALTLYEFCVFDFTSEQVFGLAHPEAAQILESVSILELQEGNASPALSLAGRAFRMNQEFLRCSIVALPEQDALIFSKKLQNSLDNYLTCYAGVESGDSVAVSEAANIILGCKGQVSDEIFQRQRSLVQERDSITQELWGRFRVTKLFISELFVEGSREDVEAWQSRMDSLSSEVTALETELCQRSPRFREERERRNVSVERIASLLPKNAVLVEYIKYDQRNFKPDKTISHYLALVMDRLGKPMIADLGRASDIDSLVTAYRDHIEGVAKQKHMPLRQDQVRYAQIALKIFDKVLKPFEDRLSGKSLIFVAPDGGLNMVSFAGLMDGKGKYLIEEHAIQYLSAGRDRIRLQYSDGGGSGLLALGDPDYSGRGITPSLLAKSRVLHKARNIRSGCGDLHTMTVDSLPATQEEVRGVAALWKAESKEPAAIFLGSEATEDNFKALAPGKRVIHLATHGYYFEGRCNPKRTKRSSEMDEGTVRENPLLLSGLLLAGANQHGKLADSLGAEDGILTAYEVSAMDLTGTDLVVLSACETGLGDVKEGEGVYGLRRAFQMAGARTVVSALWPVPDKVTAQMMNVLYRGNEKSWPERLREMQLERIRELRRQGAAVHPYSWAAFNIIGASDRGSPPPPLPPDLDSGPR